MAKTRKPLSDEFQTTDLFTDQDLDLETFIDSMEEIRDGRHIRAQHRKPSGWQRVEDLREDQWLRDQLQDWEDWDENDEV